MINLGDPDRPDRHADATDYCGHGNGIKNKSLMDCWRIPWF